MRYQLIALDVDGTLLNDDHVLTEKNKRAVEAAYNRGASIVLCTGRSPQNSLPLLDDLGLEGIMVGHNGAVTVRSSDREVLHQFAFGMDEIYCLIQFCRRYQIQYDLNTAFDMYIDHDNQEAMAMYDKFNMSPIRVKDLTDLRDNFMKFTMFASVEMIDRIEKEWEFIGCSLAPMRSGECFIDVMHPSASKGNAIHSLSEGWNIPSSRVLAIGNYYNDLEMLIYAGTGIAMGNAPDIVKAVADVVTSSNNEDGVYQAIRTFCGLDI